MDQKAYLAVASMLNAFPMGAGNPDLTMGTYEAVLAPMSSQAVIDAAQRYTMGDVPGQSKTFAPSVAEFVTEARRQQEHIKLQAKPKQQAITYHRGSLAPFEIARQKALTKFQDCPILHKDISHAEFMAFSKAGQIPVGGGWCAADCNVYGPPFEQISLGKRETAA